MVGRRAMKFYIWVEYQLEEIQVLVQIGRLELELLLYFTPFWFSVDEFEKRKLRECKWNSSGAHTICFTIACILMKSNQKFHLNSQFSNLPKKHSILYFVYLYASFSNPTLSTSSIFDSINTSNLNYIIKFSHSHFIAVVLLPHIDSCSL